MKSYNELKENILEQADSRSVVFTFGRFQPPTSGHQLLIDKVVKEAQKRGAENKIYPSHSNDKKQNPLSHKDKVLYMRKMFPKANIVDDPKAKTPFQVLTALEKEGYNNVYMVVGGDRVSEFKTRMTKYADAFDTFEVISAGHRDPDAEGVVGMSGSKMRQAAVDRDFDKFLTGVPEKVPKRISLKLFKSIRKGMGLKEEYLAVGEQTLNVRLAHTDETRARGLMNVKSMSDDDGMLFVFDEENYHGIWMKNTFIPLDVVWINESGTIVDIATLNPHDLTTRIPSQPSKYVLEVNAGTFSGKVGDKIGSVQLDEAQKRTYEKGDVVVGRRGNFEDIEAVVVSTSPFVVRIGRRKVRANMSDWNKTGRRLRESIELTELTKESRRKMARSARRSAKRRAKKRAIKSRRMKGSADIMKAARRKAMQGFKSKMLKGRDWSKLGHQEKEAIEKRIKKKYKPARIARVAHKLLPGIRQSERERIARLKGGDETVNEITTTQPGFRRKKTLGDVMKTLRVGGHRNTLTPTSAGWTDGGGDGNDKRPPCGPGSLLWNCPGYDLDEPIKGDGGDDVETSEPWNIMTLGVTSDFKNSKVNEQFRLLTEPDVLDSLVKKLKDKNPSWSDSKAYAIATASLQKRGILKKGTHELEERNYKLEYANYQGKPEQVERRSSRNKARRKLEAQGRVRKGDGKDVDHKNRNPLNNGDGNLRVRKKEHNRSFSRKNESRLPITKDKKQWTKGFWQGKKQALEDGTDRAREDRQRITPGQPVKSFTDIRKKSTR